MTNIDTDRYYDGGQIDDEEVDPEDEMEAELEDADRKYDEREDEKLFD